MDTIDIIRISFERWYNEHIADVKTTIAISYSDTQTLPIKAYHTSSAKVDAITIKDGKSNVRQLLEVSENYNHGVTSEEDAKSQTLALLLEQMYNYPL